ncbi:MAG: cupin domain-containing protein [Kiloniellaceae bacterium]
MSEVLTRGKFANPPDRETVAADWKARGYSCGTFVDPPGRRWEDFVHDRNEVVTVVEGRLEMEISGATMALDPGDEAFIPKGARHSVRNIHHGTSVWLYGYD